MADLYMAVVGDIDGMFCTEPVFYDTFREAEAGAKMLAKSNLRHGDERAVDIYGLTYLSSVGRMEDEKNDPS